MCPLVTLSVTLFSRSFSLIPVYLALQRRRRHLVVQCTYKSVTCIWSAADVVTLNWPHLKQLIKGVRTGWLTTGETGVCLGEHTVPVRRFTPDLQNDFWKCFVQFKFDQHDIDHLMSNWPHLDLWSIITVLAAQIEIYLSECDVHRYVPGIFHFLVVLKKIGTRKSPGTGIGKIWYRKKVSELVSEKFGTGKTLGTETLIFVAKI